MATQSIEMTGAQYRRRRKQENILIYVFIVVMVVATLIPFIWPFVSAVSIKAENVSGLYISRPQAFTLDHFRKAFDPRAGDALTALGNSLTVSISAVIIAVVVSTFAGYTLSRVDFRLKRSFMYGILLLQVIPSTATVLPVFLIMRTFSLINTLPGVILGLATTRIPFTIWVMKGFFDSVPNELEEAAWLDGASRFQTLFRVTMPLALPGLGAAVVLGFNSVWAAFFFPMIMLSSPDKFVLPIALFRSVIAYTALDYGMMSAMGLVYMAPSLLLFIFARQYLIRGTMAGAMAGQ